MKPRILRQAKQQVHILHRLTSRALDHIIKRGNDDQRPRPGIKVQRNIAKIAAPHIAQVCGFPRIQHTDEPLSMISILVGLAQLRLCYALLQAGIHRRDNPPVERQQVRHKHNLELFTGHVGERLLDLRRMAVRRNLIRGERLIAIRKMRRLTGGTAGACHAGFRIDHNPLRLDEPFPQSGRKPQCHAGGVTARVCKDSGLLYLRPKQLRQRINCLAMQFLMGIGPALPLRIIRFFLQTEIRAEINKGHILLRALRREFL